MARVACCVVPAVVAAAAVPPRVVDGDVAARSFLAVYEREDVPVAVLGMNQSRLFARWRRQLRTAPAR